MVRYNERERNSQVHMFTTLMSETEADIRASAADSTPGATFSISGQTINNDGFTSFAPEGMIYGTTRAKNDQVFGSLMKLLKKYPEFFHTKSKSNEG